MSRWILGFVYLIPFRCCWVFPMWRMWLHFLCLFLSVYKPGLFPFTRPPPPLPPLTPSRSVLHVTKFTPGYISNSWKRRGEKLPKRIPVLWVRRSKTLLQQNKTFGSTDTPPITRTGFFWHHRLQTLSSSYFEISEYSDY